MTNDEISKLAQECAEALVADKEFKSKNERKKAIEIESLYAVDCVKTILKRHCIVNREKIRALMNNILINIVNAHDNDDWQEVTHYILDVMPRVFVDVFGFDEIYLKKKR